MFHEPTQQGLRAIAGWTLMKRSEVHDAHANALDKLRDGCEALIPYAADGAAVVPVGEVKLPAQDCLPPRPAAPIRATEGCQHKFSIHDQRCVYCDQTYRQVRMREPELMT
jgi:hypothetical protein